MRDDRYSSEVGNRHFALEQGGIAPNTSVVKTTASKHLMGERQEAHGQLEKEKKKDADYGRAGKIHNGISLVVLQWSGKSKQVF